MPLLNLPRKPPVELCYSHILRSIGQSLEHLDLKGFELKCQDDLYLIQGWPKGTSISVGVERRYTLNDLRKLDTEGRKKRRLGLRCADPMSLSQMLRSAGRYVDFIDGRLLRVEWQHQSDKVQSITIQYEPCEAGRTGKDFPLGTVDEICVHFYKERKKTRPIPPRPFLAEVS